MLHCIDMGWFVLNKYYAITDESPVYAATLLLNPSKRARYIERNWDASWHASAIGNARTLWEEKYKGQGQSDATLALSDVSTSSQRPRNELDLLFDEITVVEDAGPDVDDFDAFILSPPIRIDGSPLKWWLHQDQIKAYPRLSRMAINILSIAPESVDPESAFSGSRRTLSWDRESMSCENLEKVECIGNWIREGLIKPSREGGRGIVVDTGFDREDSTEIDNEID